MLAKASSADHAASPPSAAAMLRASGHREATEALPETEWLLQLHARCGADTHGRHLATEEAAVLAAEGIADGGVSDAITGWLAAVDAETAEWLARTAPRDNR